MEYKDVKDGKEGREYERYDNKYERYERYDKNDNGIKNGHDSTKYDGIKYDKYDKSKNSWKFHTYINPNKNQDSDPLIAAFEIFLKEVIIDKETLYNELKLNKIKRIVINTNNNDVIEIPNKSVKQQFLRSKFLENKKFKQRLIDYYNTIGVFIKGPTQFRKRDGTLTNHWIIELNLIYEKR